MAGKVSDQLILVLIVAASAALAIPALLVPVPPLFDYANHLVRLWLIAGGAHGPPLAQMYAPAWEQAFTNVGIDYVGAVLGWIVPATAVGTGMLVFATALPPLGALLLNRALFGGLHWSQVAILFFAWNATLIAGFLNFHIGIGLALAGAALEPRLGTSSMALRASARAAIGFLLIVVHAFGLLYYCALITGLSIGRSLGPLADLKGLAARAGGALAAAAAAALPSFLVIVLAPALPGAHTDAVGKAPFWDFSLASKSYVLLSPIATYHLAVDVAFALAALTPLAAVALAGRCEAHAGLLILAAAMTLIALLAPAAVAGTWWIDNRFPLMAVLALLAGLRPNAPLRQRTTAALAVLLTFIVVLRTGWIAAVWLERQQDVAAVARAVEPVPAGAAILPLDNVDEAAGPGAHPLGRLFHNGHPTYWSYPVLAIMWRQAFVPNLFWAAGKQPIRVLPPWDEISYPEDGLWRSRILTAPQELPDHFRHWRQRYQFVLLLNADVGSGADLSQLDELRLERDEGFARLYRIVAAPAVGAR